MSRDNERWPALPREAWSDAAKTLLAFLESTFAAAAEPGDRDLAAWQRWHFPAAG